MRGVGFASVAALCVLANAAGAEPRVGRAGAKASSPPAWCAPGVEALPGDVCHVDGGDNEGRRTLVIFLHGAIAKNTTWQWTQERALARQAKHNKFEAIFPRGPSLRVGYLWPGSAKTPKGIEEQLIEEWTAARKLLEARNGRPFDEVFVLGFSSGAYFVSLLALRGLLDADGFATFAGALSVPSPTDLKKRVPVFVGVCGKDSMTAPQSRVLGATLATRGWPHRTDELRVGHGFDDVHVAHALAYLRA